MPKPDFTILNLSDDFGPADPVAGILPLFLDEGDPDDAVTQIDKNYVHGGGWRDFEGFDLTQGFGEKYALSYPEDPLLQEVWRTKLRDETVVLFQYSWVAVIQPDGSYRIARID